MSVVTESPLLCFLLHQSRTERLDHDLQATQWLPTATHWPGHLRGEEMSTPPCLSCICHGKFIRCTLFSDLCVRLLWAAFSVCVVHMCMCIGVVHVCVFSYCCADPNSFCMSCLRHIHSGVHNTSYNSDQYKYLSYKPPVTNSMEQSDSSDINCIWASQEIPHILQNLYVHYHVHSSPPFVPYPEPDKSSPCSPILFLQIHFNIVLPPMLRSSRWFLSFRFSNQNVVDHASPTCLWQWYKPIIVGWFKGYMSKNKINGIPNCLNFCKTSVVDIQFTNLVVGCIIQPDGPAVDLHVSRLSSLCPVPHPTHPHKFDHWNKLWWRVQNMSLFSARFLQSPVTSFQLGPYIFFSALFLNICSLCYFLDIQIVPLVQNSGHNCHSLCFRIYIFRQM